MQGIVHSRLALIFLLALAGLFSFVFTRDHEGAESVQSLASVEIVAEGFRELRGIALDEDGFIYVSDREAGSVTKIASDGTKTLLVTALERPIGLALDLEGRILIAEEKAGRVVRLGSNGSLTPVVEGIKQPRWLTVSEDGTLFISARRLTRDTDPEPDDESAEPEVILSFSPAGQLRVFADGFKNLQGLAVTEDALYAATRGLRDGERADGVIFKIPILADGSAAALSQLGPADSFKKPVGLVLDRLGALYLTTKEIELLEDKSKRAVAKLFTDGSLNLFASNLEKPQGVAFDGNGNLYLGDGNSGRVLRFRAPPPPTLVFPSFTNQNPLAIQGTTEANSGIDAFLNDSTSSTTITTQDGTFSLTLNLTPNTQNLLSVLAIAHNGQGLTSAPAELTIVHDDVAPRIADLQPADGTHLNTQTPLMRADFFDSGSGVETARVQIQLDSTTVTNQAQITPTGFSLTPSSLAQGLHTVSVTIFDRAGNSALAQASFIVDVTPPDTQITAGPEGNIGETTATFTFTGTDNLTPIESLQFAWRFDGGGWSSFSSKTTVTFTGLAEGSYTFEVKARDLAGNEDSTPDRREFSVVLGPVITSFSPGSGTLGSEVTIQGRGFDPAPGKTIVRFNGVQAVITSVNQTSIRTTVPINATTGRITVETPKGTGTSVQDFIVLLRQDFALSVSPDVGSAMQGTSTTYAVRIVSTGIEPFTGLASLAVSGLPAGVTGGLTPQLLSTSATGLLTLTTSSSAAVGSYPVEVRATSQIEGRVTTRAALVTLAVQALGQTILIGQVRDENERPLPGVSIKQGGTTFTDLGITDAGGNFFIPLSVSGPQVFLIDGSTANTPTVNYPTVPVTVDIQPGVVNTLGFTPKLQGQPVAKLMPITPGQAAVLTEPELPGFKMEIPSGAQIIGWDGKPNTQFSVAAVPIDRSPLPPIPSDQSSRVIYLFSFGKMGGGIPIGNIPIDTPNDVGGLPGDKIDLYYFNEAPDGTAPNRWEQYGTGTVSSDGTRIITDINPANGLPYGIPRFCCGARRNVIPPAPQAGGGPSGGQSGSGQTAGEPVDTATGLFYLDKTDMVLPGILPIAITRTYRTQLTNAGPFGLGTSWPYDIFLQPPPNGSSDSLLLFTPGNRQDLFARQPDGTFINTTSPPLRGAVITMAGGVRSLRFKDGSLWRFDSSGRLISQADRNGNTVTLTRDGQGRVTQIIEPSGRALTLFYTGINLRIDSIRDPLGREVRYAYDGSGRLTSVTDAAGGVTSYTYDSSNRMVSITDPRGITFLTNEYDSAGRVVRQTQADGGVWTFAYTTSGSFISQTTVNDPRGNNTTYRFNASGFLTSQTDALEQITTFERQTGSNLLLSTTDSIGRVTRFEYDAAGNVTKITDPAENVRRFEYEPTFNKLTKITDPLGQITSFEYDAKGNLTATVDPTGARTTIAYNTSGQPVSTTDPLGNVTTFTYDTVGNLATIADPLGNKTQRTYDLVSRLIAQTDPRAKTTVFGYDELNRITQILDALNGLTSFTYDPNGNLLTVSDARGNVIAHSYDSMDRLAARSDPVGAVESFAYDDGGNLTRHIDRKGQVNTFNYDALNRRIAGSYADGATTSFIYDAAGRLIQATDSVGGTILNQYDTLDRLITQVTGLGAMQYSYDALGRRTSMSAPGQAAVTYSYDAASRLRQVVQGTQVVDLTYDLLGQRTRLTLPNGVSTEYQYDAASRLTALIYRNTLGVLGDLTYQYDAAGNRIAVGGSFARTLLPDLVPSATYDAANHQLQFADKTMTFDANGNLTSITDSLGVTNFTWDARNRLTSLAAPNTNASFMYDAFGRRLEKTVSGQRSQFQYDTVNIVAEFRDGNFVNYLRGLSIDEVFSVTDVAGIRYASTDTLGSIINLIDADGVVQANYQYGPFGIVQRSGQDSGNPFQFSGRENDGTGLHYYRFRYYHPILSRFISEDPLQPLAGIDLNLYAYVSNSPLNAVDPFGLYEEDVHQDLTYFLARKAGLPDLAAQRIAASDQGTDDNAATSPFASTEARRDWHFTTPERRAELWQRALDGGIDQLGQYLHALQDSYSHEGYTPQYGHWTHRPDKTYNDPEKANRMARDTYNRLRQYLQRLTGQPVPDHWEHIRDQVDRFNRARTAHQKKKILGR